MKKLFSILILWVVLFAELPSYGQIQNNGNPVGLDRSIGGANMQQREPAKIEPIDYGKLMVEKLTTRLGLDGFQSAVAKNLVDNFIKKTGEIALEDIPTDAKIEKSKIARTEMEKKFAEIFTEKQKVLFEEFLIESNGKIKKNKKKKKKEDTESKE